MSILELMEETVSVLTAGDVRHDQTTSAPKFGNRSLSDGVSNILELLLTIYISALSLGVDN